MNVLHIGSTMVEDTFAEAFRMRFTRLLITALDLDWAKTAAVESTGYGSSVIGCDLEAGIERFLTPEESPDGRPGVALLFFGFSTDAISKAVANRVGQCVLTCPTTAVFDGMDLGSEADPAGASTPLEGLEVFPLGKNLRYFGDGFQSSKVLQGRRFWRVPVMDGEFLIEEAGRTAKGIAGGNFIIEGASQEAALKAARRAVDAIALLPEVITPFPGGVARSGSKVGSRYRKLRASTNDAFCPTIRSRVDSKLHPDANAVYEIIINGTGEASIARAMRTGIEAACNANGNTGIVLLSAGNFGGKLGKFHFHLHEVLR